MTTSEHCVLMIWHEVQMHARCLCPCCSVWGFWLSLFGQVIIFWSTVNDCGLVYILLPCLCCVWSAPFLSKESLSARWSPGKLFVFENSSFIYQRNLAWVLVLMKAQASVIHNQWPSLESSHPDFQLIWLDMLCTATQLEYFQNIEKQSRNNFII